MKKYVVAFLMAIIGACVGGAIVSIAMSWEAEALIPFIAVGGSTMAILGLVLDDSKEKKDDD